MSLPGVRPQVLDFFGTPFVREPQFCGERFEETLLE
jgi:hypothetical protein